MLTEVMTDLGKLTEEVHKFAFEIVFAQLKNYLANVSFMEVCNVLTLTVNAKLKFHALYIFTLYRS